MAIPEPEFRNSAGRLLAILAVIPDNKAIDDILPNIFDKKPSQKRKEKVTYEALRDLQSIYLEFQQDMFGANITEIQRTALLSGLVSIELSIYPSNISSAFRKPTEAEFSLLRVCATFITQEGQIGIDDIEAIRNSIAQLRDLVEKARVSPTLRKTLLELIRLSEDAISRFNIEGAKGLKRAFKHMLADAAELYLRADTQEKSELNESSAWTSIWKHIKLLDAIASKVLQYQPMLEGAAVLLLGQDLQE